MLINNATVVTTMPALFTGCIEQGLCGHVAKAKTHFQEPLYRLDPSCEDVAALALAHDHDPNRYQLQVFRLAHTNALAHFPDLYAIRRDHHDSEFSFGAYFDLPTTLHQ